MSTTPPPPDRPDLPTGPGGYPVHPGTPAGQQGGFGPGGSAVPAAQPSSIRLAVRLMWAGAALSLLGLIVMFATLGSFKSQLRDALEKSDSNYSQSTYDTAYAVGIGSAVLAAVIGVALWLWMAWKNGEGRPWARIVATVFGGLNLVSTLYTVSAGTATGASIAVTIVSLVLSVGILVLLWRKESSAFYAARSRPQWG